MEIKLEKDDDNRPIAIMLVGHQYTGKSTWIAKKAAWLIENGNSKYFNLDSVVHELAKKKNLTYAEAWANVVGEATSILNSRLKEWIAKKENLIIDRTNMTRKSRASIAKQLKDYEIYVMVFPNLTDEELEKRIASRPDQIVPLEVVKSFRNNFEEISEDEIRELNYKRVTKVVA